jgi:hypothetical protein
MKRASCRLLAIMTLAFTFGANAQFKYTVNADGESVTITGYTGSVPPVLIIPSNIDGLAVNAIGGSSPINGAFESATSLKNVFIPPGVSIDGYRVFAFSALTNVTISYGVNYIGVEAFNGCTNLANIVIPESVTNIDRLAFNDTGITSVTIPGSVTSVGWQAFTACANLTNVIIEPGLTSLGQPDVEADPNDSQFAGNQMLRTVTIPGTLTNITDGAFAQCTNLTQIYFTGNAPMIDNTVFEYLLIQPPPHFEDLPFYFATAYYLPGTTGWAEFSSNTVINPSDDNDLTTNIFIPAALWNPTIQPGGPNFGIQSNQFGFDITGTTNIPIVVEGCTNLVQPAWVPLQSMNLTNGLVHFSEPFDGSYPVKFYRIGEP